MIAKSGIRKVEEMEWDTRYGEEYSASSPEEGVEIPIENDRDRHTPNGQDEVLNLLEKGLGCTLA